ncbi:carboxypeptidase-like regulatory domain-containing protein [Hymenobacter sp. H14-R3]|uniref:carboxypeptidase-like regulatory domain-containing protein n=1 Tax=Hymenobacter sp. H14-R3 TaxID=3046308 RepID=UPI0024BB07F6|nr:carboxypeptidase-like regulatory domain-containing protein [Hymenobacter sp. H14-R3]MDJ0365997.1 carboxypeptidase-like regulatory domain-containing protein [Hymenobacter sp. H14-R3]
MNSSLAVCSLLAPATARTVAVPVRRPRAWGLAALVVATGLAGCGHTPETTSATAPATAPALAAAPTTAPPAPAPAPTVAPTKVIAKIKPARASRIAPVVAAAAAPVAEEVAVPAPEPAAAPAAPTTRTQAGRILDENGRPLVGATVLLRGSGKGTSTDASGSYSLEVPTGSNTFSVGYGGYEDETATSSDGQPLNVTLLPKPSGKATGRRPRR